MKIQRTMVLLGALLSLGCADPTSPARLNGTWARDSSIPGSALSFTLATQGDAVSGGGRWSGEACCDGSVQIVGTATDAGINLDFAFIGDARAARVTAFTEHFTGRLTDANTLAGALTTRNYLDSVTYRRK